MSKVIRIPNELHERLANYAEGFDTPANVIERMLNQYEEIAPSTASNDDVEEPVVEMVAPACELPAEPEKAAEPDVVIAPEVATVPEVAVVHDTKAEPEITAQEPAGLLPITLTPDSEERFKKELLKIKKAKIRIFYADGKTVDKTWNAFKFDSDSNVMTNLRSRAEFRQDEWIRNGITHAEVSIDYTL